MDDVPPLDNINDIPSHEEDVLPHDEDVLPFEEDVSPPPGVSTLKEEDVSPHVSPDSTPDDVLPDLMPDDVSPDSTPDDVSSDSTSDDYSPNVSLPNVSPEDVSPDDSLPDVSSPDVSPEDVSPDDCLSHDYTLDCSSDISHDSPDDAFLPDGFSPDVSSSDNFSTLDDTDNSLLDSSTSADHMPEVSPLAVSEDEVPTNKDRVPAVEVYAPVGIICANKVFADKVSASDEWSLGPPPSLHFVTDGLPADHPTCSNLMDSLPADHPTCYNMIDGRPPDLPRPDGTVHRPPGRFCCV